MPPGTVFPPELAAGLAGKLAELTGRQSAVRLLTPLPRRARGRLAAERAVDGVATWLVYHDRPGMAERVWRMFGMWH